jgi:hypothetical protein
MENADGSRRVYQNLHDRGIYTTAVPWTLLVKTGTDLFDCLARGHSKDASTGSDVNAGIGAGKSIGTVEYATGLTEHRYVSPAMCAERPMHLPSPRCLAPPPDPGNATTRHAPAVIVVVLLSQGTYMC